MTCVEQCPNGTHDCSGVCIANTSVNGCGTNSCTPCPVPQNGQATCDGSMCGIRCGANYKFCNGECIPQAGCCSNEPSSCMASALCSASHVCDCLAGQKKCGTGAGVTCLPAGSCCDSAECSAGRTCQDGSCVSWCGTQAIPSGVAASDHQCVDFEAGLPATWTLRTAGQGTGAISSARASSVPQSFLSTVQVATGAAARDMGRLEWTATGPTQVRSATISARFNPGSIGTVTPNWYGYVGLTCLRVGFQQVCLGYTKGATVHPGGVPQDNYTGFILDWWNYDPSAPYFGPFTCALLSSVALSPNVWTPFHLTWSNNSVAAQINGTPVGNCGLSVADTNLTVFVGLSAEFGEPGVQWPVHFDDVVVSVGR